MHMLAGTLIVALFILIFLHVIFWKIRSIRWLNNMFITLVAWTATVAAAIGLFIIGGVHKPACHFWE